MSMIVTVGCVCVCVPLLTPKVLIEKKCRNIHIMNKNKIKFEYRKVKVKITMHGRKIIQVINSLHFV